MKTLLLILISTVLFAQSVSDEKKAERIEMLDGAFTILEEKIADPEWLEAESFNSLKELMYSDSVLSLSDKEFTRTFSQAKKDLPFTHFTIYKKRSSTENSGNSTSNERKSLVSWEAVDEHTAYLKIDSWMVSGATVNQALQEIGFDTYENLIIDLRENGGGHLEGPIAIAQFLSNTPLDGGYYLTRKWFDNEDSLPGAEAVQSMPMLEDLTYAGIKKIFDEEDAFRLVLPGHERPVYQGNTYILIGSGTGSSSEGLVYPIQKLNMATLVGEPTAGALLSGSSFDINENYGVFLPTADYYMFDGFKVDKVGVQPDIEVEASQAKKHVLKLIEESR